MEHKVAFLDTNYFLHYRSVEEVDWLKLLNAESADLIVAPVVIRELNEIKELGDRKKLRKRADSALKRLAGILRQPAPAAVKKCVALGFRQNDPVIDFHAHKLNDQIADDWLIATILEFRTEFPESRIALVTNDVGLQLKAVGHGVEHVELPEVYSLPDEPDPDQKRIEELTRELNAYKSSAPDLMLAFGDGKDHFRVQLARIPLITDEEVSRRMEELRCAHPKALKPQAYSGADLMRGGVGSHDIDRHNKRLDNFYLSYEKYLRALAEFEDRQRRLFRLGLILVNLGSAPAEDIDADLHVPDGILVLDNPESVQIAPLEPKAPEGPKSTMQERLEMARNIAPVALAGLPARLSDLAAGMPSVGLNVSKPTVRRTKSFEIHFHVQQLKHTFQVGFDALFGVFDSWDTAKPFTIDYELVAANVPQPVDGQLHVIPEIVESAGS
jgi:hypothetical protein